MAPLIALVAVTALARLVGRLGAFDWLDSWPHAVQLGLAAMFVLTTIAHFVQPLRKELIAMVPPRIPNAPAVVTVTGVLELAGAIGLLIPVTTRLAAACLAVLMVVMFPANMYEAGPGRGIKTMPLPLRAVLQVVFIGACVFVILG
ncbi:DoxX family protein [Stackebrandtia soli]|uniref:DoxX family protein n=1 Tax=Stackebrandtia soli TaxID=1892856 RepID=UPI0039E82A3A